MENKQDFVIKDGVLDKYTGPGGDVAIPAGVTEIGQSAFKGCASLTSVTIPASVTEIRWGAFYGCPKLANQQGMVIIHGILFEYMGSNRDVTIPAGVTEIGESAFKG